MRVKFFAMKVESDEEGAPSPYSLAAALQQEERSLKHADDLFWKKCHPWLASTDSIRKYAQYLTKLPDLGKVSAGYLAINKLWQNF